MNTKTAILSTIDRLGAAEPRHAARRFIAPVIAGAKARVTFARTTSTFTLAPAAFRGIGVFRTLSPRQAMLEYPATPLLRRQYLDSLPAVRLIVLARREELLAVAAGQADQRLIGPEIVRVQLPICGLPFDAIVARYDGSRFWFDSMDESADPAAAPYLRLALMELVPESLLAHRGLTPAQRRAYAALIPECLRLRPQQSCDAVRETPGRTPTVGLCLAQ